MLVVRFGVMTTLQNCERPESQSPCSSCTVCIEITSAPLRQLATISIILSRKLTGPVRPRRHRETVPEQAASPARPCALFHVWIIHAILIHLSTPADARLARADCSTDHRVSGVPGRGIKQASARQV